MSGQYDGLDLNGEYSYQIFDRKRRPKSDRIIVPNAITDAGRLAYLSLLFSTYPSASTYRQWYIGLVDANNFSGYSSFQEFTYYNNKNTDSRNRPVWNNQGFSAAVTSMDTTLASVTPATYVFSTNAFIQGFFLARDALKSNPGSWQSVDPPGVPGTVLPYSAPFFSMVVLHNFLSIAAGESIDVTYSITG